jgi:hypothetical protein
MRRSDSVILWRKGRLGMDGMRSTLYIDVMEKKKRRCRMKGIASAGMKKIEGNN